MELKRNFKKFLSLMIITFFLVQTSTAKAVNLNDQNKSNNESAISSYQTQPTSTKNISYDRPANIVQPPSKLTETDDSLYKGLQTRYSYQSSNIAGKNTNEDYQKLLLTSRARLDSDDGQSTTPQINYIALNDGNINYYFDSSVENYDIDVPSYVGTIGIKAYYDPNYNLQIFKNGTPLQQDNGFADVDINPSAVTRITFTISSDSASKTYTINIHPIELDVEPKVIYSRQNTAVKFTAKKDGSPLTNMQINTMGLRGTTGSDGSCSINFNLSYSQDNIEVFIGSLRFSDALSCINQGDSLLQINGTDIGGKPIMYFHVNAAFRNGNNIDMDSDGSGKINIIESQGSTCDITFASRSYGKSSAYFLRKSNIQINSEINSVTLNPSGTVQSTLYYSFDGNNNLGNGDLCLGYFDLGIIRSGVKSIYAASGNYDITAKFYCYNDKTSRNEILLFHNKEVGLNGNNASFPMSTAETGTLTLNYLKPNSNSNSQDVIVLDGMYLDRNSDFQFIRAKAGNYTVDSLIENYTVSTSQGDSYFQYNYYEPWNSDINDYNKETLNISIGNNTTFTRDLSYKQSIVYKDRNIAAQDSDIYCFMGIRTNSGYEIRQINGNDYNKYNTVYTNFNTGNNPPIRSFKRDIGDGYYYIDNDMPSDNYTISMKRDIGPLYGSDGLTDYYANASSALYIGYPSLTASVQGNPNGIMHVGKPCSISFNFSINGSPLSGKTIRINGNEAGITDSNGNATISSFTPDYSGNYYVSIDGFERGYNYLLSAVENDQVVVEVNCCIQNMRNYSVHDFDKYGYGTESTDIGEKVRFITNPGDYTFELTSGSNGSNPSYYLTKKMNVVYNSSQLCTIEFDADTSDTVKADFNFSYDGNQIAPEEVFIEKLNETDRSIGQSIGGTNGSSVKSVYLTKGDYKVSFKGRNSSNTLMYLSKEIDNISESNAYSASFDSSAAGNLSIEFSGDITSGRGKSLNIDGTWVYIGNDTNLLMDAGNHQINYVAFRIESNGMEYWANFSRVNNNNDIITITNDCGTAFIENFNIDKGFKFTFDKSFYTPGENMRFAIVGTNISGRFYYSGLYPYDDNMTVVITDPNGKQIFNGRMGFLDGNYLLPSDAPLGTYTIYANADFGVAYGPQNLTAAFKVQSLPTVTADKHFIRSGIDNTVTFTVKDAQGAVLPNEPIEIRSAGTGANIYFKGTTDANGQYTVTMNLSGNQDIYTVVKGHELWEIAFSGESGVELLRASAKGKDGSPLKDFILLARTKDFAWGTTGERNTANVDALAKVGNDEAILIKNFSDATYFMVKSVNVQAGLADDINYVNFDASTSGSVVSQNLSLAYNGSTFKLDDLFIKKSDSISSKFNHVGAYDGTSHIFYVAPGNYDIEAIGTDASGNRLFLTKYNVSMASDNANNVINWTSADTSEINLNITGLQSEDVKKELSVNNYVFDMGYSSKVIASLGTYNIKPIVSGTFNGKNADYTFSNNTQTTISSAAPLQLNLDLGIQSLKLKADPSIVNPGDNVNYGMELITNSGYALESISGDNIEYGFNIVKPSGNPEQITSGSFNGNTYKVSPDAAYGTYTINASFDFGSLYGSKFLSSCFICRKGISGDINGDNKVDSQDTDQLKKILLGKYEGSITYGIKVLSDVDGDGKITSADYAIIKRWLQGKITQLP